MQFLDILAWVGTQVLKPLRPIGRLVRRPLGYVARRTGLSTAFPWAELRDFVTPYYVGDEKRMAWTLGSVTMVLMVLNTLSTKKWWDIAGRLEGAYQAKVDATHTLVQLEADFWSAIYAFVAITFIWAAINVSYWYFRPWWQQHWQRWHCQYFGRHWVANDGFNKLAQEYPELTTVDVRLAPDVEITTDKLIWLGVQSPEVIFNMVVFVPGLWFYGWWFVGICVGLAVVNLFVVPFLGRKLSALQEWLPTATGNIRTLYQTVIAQSRAVAFQGSGALVEKRSLENIAEVYKTQRQIANINMFMSLFNTPWNTLIGYVPKVWIGWFVLQGTKTVDMIAPGANAFAMVYNGLTLLSSQFPSIAQLKGELRRIGPLARALKSIGENRMPPGEWITYARAELLTFNKVTVYNSYIDKSPVIKELTLTVNDNVMFSGQSGAGKSSLADAMVNGAARGLGEIGSPLRNKIVGICNPIYLQSETLRLVLTDRCTTLPADAEIVDALKNVGLAHLIDPANPTESLNKALDWTKKLKPAEQLMLSLARAILSKPELVVIDQALSGIEAEVIAWLYRVLRLSKIRFVTMTNDTTLAQYHDRVIDIDENGVPHEHLAHEFKEPSWKIWIGRLWGSQPEEPAADDSAPPQLGPAPTEPNAALNTQPHDEAQAEPGAAVPTEPHDEAHAEPSAAVPTEPHDEAHAEPGAAATAEAPPSGSDKPPPPPNVPEDMQ